MWEIYNGNVKEIEDFMDVKSWVRTHRDYWKNPANSYENIEGYKIEFRNFINQYLD